MNAIDLTPLYRNSIGFDRLASMLNNLSTDTVGSGYPPTISRCWTRTVTALH